MILRINYITKKLITTSVAIMSLINHKNTGKHITFIILITKQQIHLNVYRITCTGLTLHFLQPGYSHLQF